MHIRKVYIWLTFKTLDALKGISWTTFFPADDEK